MLDPEFKAKWIAALRSGKYKQGTQYLCNGGYYCCLGVACELEGLLVDDTTIKGGSRAKKFIGTVQSGAPTAAWAKAHGFPNGMDELIRMNDTGVTFEKIADFIEQNY